MKASASLKGVSRMAKVKIRTLPENPAGCAVYRRNNGEIFLRLNERFHVRVKKGKTKTSWIGDGNAEQINLDEEVEVIRQATR